MSDTVWAAIVGGAAGIITGSISSLIAPWANWGIEKRRNLHETRKQIIQNVRRMIIDYRAAIETQYGDKPLGYSLSKTGSWLRVKPYLQTSVLDEVNGASNLPIRSQKAQSALSVLEQEITRIESRWKLV